MKPRVFPRAGEEGKGPVPHSGPRGAGAASLHTHREGPGPAAPKPARDGAGARSNERHRHPLRTPSDARATSPPLPPPRAPGTFQKLPLVLGALRRRRRLARPALRHPSLRHGSAKPRGPTTQRRGRPQGHPEPQGAGGGTSSTGSREQEEEKQEREPPAPPLLTPPGRGHAPAPTAARRMRLSRSMTALLWCTGARVGFHVLEMR